MNNTGQCLALSSLWLKSENKSKSEILKRLTGHVPKCPADFGNSDLDHVARASTELDIRSTRVFQFEKSFSIWESTLCMQIGNYLCLYFVKFCSSFPLHSTTSTTSTIGTVTAGWWMKTRSMPQWPGWGTLYEWSRVCKPNPQESRCTLFSGDNPLEYK